MRRLFRSCRLRARKKTLCRSSSLAYSPAEDAERMLFGEVNAVLLFCLRKSAGSAGDIGVSSVYID